MKMKNIKNPKTSIFKRIFHQSYKIRDIRSKDFLEKLHSHQFKTDEELIEALSAWNYATWTKSVALAVHTQIEGFTSIRHIFLQYKLREGMEYRHIVEEYDYDGPALFPKWYTNALEKMNEQSQNSS